MCDSEKTEAESAVDAYLFHWEKAYAKVVDFKCKAYMEKNPKLQIVSLY